MGGKGRRRREKNYIAAHGGHTGLPPPPRPKDIDAIPSKLRRIMQFTTNNNAIAPFTSGDTLGHEPNKNYDFGNKKLKGKGSRKKNSVTGSDCKKKYAGEMQLVNKELENKKGLSQQPEIQGGSSTRKRKKGDDLRILLESQNLAPTGKRKWDRKKRYLDAKKQKRVKSKYEDDADYPQHEVIKFGEVVTAPPKLEFPKKVPMEFKVRKDVSQERVRLQAIEDYRHRKGWTSRPGSHIPPLNLNVVV